MPDSGFTGASHIATERPTLFQNMLFLEIFAGTSSLTMEVRKTNLRGVAVDKTTERAKGPITILDLTLEEDLKFLENFIVQEHNLCLIHLAPPCGTGSAARKRKLPPDISERLREAGITPPQQLRSEDFPMGLPHIAGLDRYKVEQANLLYEATKRIAMLAISLNIRVSIENPTNSLFWKTDPIVELLQFHPGYINIFHNCMMGGDRQKQTTWWCSDDFFNSFNLPCSLDHDHKPWTPTITADGVHYPTKDEAEYPKLLCARVAALLVADLKSKGIEQPDTFQQQIGERRNTAVNSVAMGLLPRGQKLRPLVSEFGHYVQFAIKPDMDAKIILQDLVKGARITDRKLLTGGDMRVSGRVNASLQYLGLQEVPESMKVELITIGIPREPWDFVHQAALVGHPRFLPYAGSPHLDTLLKANLGQNWKDLERHRLSFFKRWLARAKELEVDERNLKEQLNEHVRHVLQGKRLLLFKEILEDLEFPDKQLFEDIVAGFRLSGWMRDSQLFLSLPRPPKLTFEALLRSSLGLQEAVLQKVSEPEDEGLHRAAWTETLAELDKHWIWEDNTGDLSGKVIAHRFGLQQGEKVRVIDNFKLCGLNDSCGLPEKFTLHGVDFIAASLIRALVLRDQGHQVCLKGKTFDLKSAYKQYPLHSTDRAHLRIAIRDPDSNEPKLFGLNSLPFGATGSVAGFLRVSSALFFILSAGLQVWCSAFFDDFPTMSVAALSKSTDQCVGLLFDMLGIQFAKEGKKSQAFGPEMKALGLIFDLSQFDEGVVYIKHTPERRAELLAKINSILEQDSLTPKEAESFRGRIQWFESYLFGRIANLSIHRIGKRAQQKGSKTKSKLDDELRSSLIFLRTRVQTGSPLLLTAETEDSVLIFTDGAFDAENLKGSVGGVLLDHKGRPLRFFSENLPALVMKRFLEVSDNPIYLIELLAGYIAAFLWGGLTTGRYVVMYIDNEASRLALIKAYSSTPMGNVIVQMFVSSEDSSQWKVWFGRVCSYSNIADAPSRMEVQDLVTRGAMQDKCAWDVILLKLEETEHNLGLG